MLPEDRRFWRSQWDDSQLEVFHAFKAAVKALETDLTVLLPKLGQELKVALHRSHATPEGVNRYGGRIS